MPAGQCAEMRCACCWGDACVSFVRGCEELVFRCDPQRCYSRVCLTLYECAPLAQGAWAASLFRCLGVLLQLLPLLLLARLLRAERRRVAAAARWLRAKWPGRRRVLPDGPPVAG